jgi:hypothetical protein
VSCNQRQCCDGTRRTPFLKFFIKRRKPERRSGTSFFPGIDTTNSPLRPNFGCLCVPNPNFFRKTALHIIILFYMNIFWGNLFISSKCILHWWSLKLNLFKNKVHPIFSYGTTAHIWALFSSVLSFLNQTQLNTRQDSSAWVFNP